MPPPVGALVEGSGRRTPTSAGFCARTTNMPFAGRRRASTFPTSLSGVVPDVRC